MRFEFLSSSASVDDPAARFAWRVLAANNRPLGRSVTVHESLADAIAAAIALRDALDGAVTRVGPGGRPAEPWLWRVEVDGTPVAVCVHAYQRRIECARALSQFLAGVRGAEPGDGAVRHYGPQTLRSYAPLVAKVPS
jgi:hypothetical protein